MGHVLPVDGGERHGCRSDVDRAKVTSLGYIGKSLGVSVFPNFGVTWELTEREMPYAKWSPERENALTLMEAVPSEESRLGCMGDIFQQFLHMRKGDGTYVKKDFPSRTTLLRKIWECAVFGTVDD